MNLLAITWRHPHIQAMPIPVRMTEEQIEHLAACALEVGAADVVSMCDEALRSGDDSRVMDVVANDVTMAEWMDLGRNDRYRKRQARTAWIPGPPPGRGRWWVVWRLRSGIRVEPVEVGPAVIMRDNPDARLLVKLLSGTSYEFSATRDDMTHHMPIDPPSYP